ncbi:cytochrome c oxidase subunit 3 [Coralloluteibacterium thermophilus]|uniref:cytochrome-c oxidase n=1 Tax=Coralloluteibacterium thermophilum TaxID=2707049 RepID=A0ABV9NMH6_9GAMM
MAHASTGPNAYYVPAKSIWPLFGSAAVMVALAGAAAWLNDYSWGPLTFAAGMALVIVMFFGWFAAVIRESVGGNYSKQVDVSFRMGMLWFIFSEIMFFAAFFGALFYARALSVPWLGGAGSGEVTNVLLWSAFDAGWPTAGPEQIGGEFQTIPAWGLPLLNTLILLTSGVTITMAHHALKAGQRTKLLVTLGATILLGLVFLFFQAEEYVHAYRDLNLTLGSGIYGSTFFMLTGFHGLHVLLGTIMLIVMWFRCYKGHFTKDNHFGFEATAWYWHFVDVVWLGLFLFVYVV